MDVVIRPAELADAAALALVGQASFLESYAGQLPAANIISHCTHEHSVERYAGWLEDGERRIWIAEAAEGRAPVGYAVLSPADLPVATEPGDLELKRLYVLGRLHGTGLGARLTAAVMEAAQAFGAPRLLVGVFQANARAIAFYARQGFRQVGERRFRVGEGVYDDLVLARPLAAPKAT